MHAVLNTYMEVYRVLFYRRTLLARFGAVMCAAVVGFWALCTYGIGWTAPVLPFDPQPWIYLVLGLWFSVLLAVRWHRLVLLDERGAGLLDFWPGRREIWFLARLFLVGLAAGVFISLILSVLVLSMNLTSLAAATLSSHATVGSLLPAMSMLIFPTLQSAAFAFGLARLGLILPAAALERPLSIRESWQATAGHGLPFFTLIVFVELPVLIVENLFNLVDIPEVVSLPLYMAVWWVTIAATATALSFNYAAVIGRPSGPATQR